MSREEEGNWVPWDDAITVTQMVPFADRPCDEIVPGLFMGGHDFGPDGKPVVLAGEFDHVFSLYRRWGHGPDDDVPHEYLSLRDSRLGDQDLERVRNFAGRVWDAYEHDVTGLPPKILIRCRSGYNRSGLVVGFVLMRMGFAPVRAVDLIREKRGPWALCNAWFVSYIDDEWRRINGK